MQWFHRALTWRGWVGSEPRNLCLLEVDQICCYKRGQFEDFELTFRPEIIDNIVYVVAPRDKVLRYP